MTKKRRRLYFRLVWFIGAGFGYDANDGTIALLLPGLYIEAEIHKPKARF